MRYFIQYYFKNNLIHLQKTDAKFLELYKKYDKTKRMITSEKSIRIEECEIYMYCSNSVSTDSNDSTTIKCEFLKHCNIIDYENHNNYNVILMKYNKQVVCEDYKYIEVLDSLLAQRSVKNKRTGVKTRSMSSVNISFDISNGKIPLTTYRKIPYRHIISELVWILRGYTDTKFLEDNGNKVWRGNTTRKFLDSLKSDIHIETGTIGKGYGKQLRNFEGIDQLKYMDDLIKTEPSSRRIMFSLWNPKDLNSMALPPCHFCFMIKIDGEYMDSSLVMRSSDELARSWNCTFYSILTHLFAHRHGYKARKFTIFMNDCHIYENAIEQAKLYRGNSSRNFPIIVLDKSLKEKSWDYMSIEDFNIVGYFPNKFYKIDMVV